MDSAQREGKSQLCFMINAYLKDSLQSDDAELELRSYQLIRWQLKTHLKIGGRLKNTLKITKLLTQLMQ